MNLLEIVVFIYLIIGIVYALFLVITASQKMSGFLINVIFGPPVLIYILITSIIGKRLPIDTPDV